MMSRFKEIYRSLRADRPYNLHTHTQYCDGRATTDQFAAAAGMSHLGFSPHSPIPIPSTCNMTRGAVYEFLADVERLREEYEGKVEVLASMEIDYLGSEWGPANDYFSSLPLDYRIGSVHFIPNQEGVYYDIDGRPERFLQYLREQFRDDLRYVVETFYASSIEMVRAGGLDIIGHLDKIGHNASAADSSITARDWYRALVSDLIEEIKARDIAVEINTKAYASAGRMFPSPDFWPEIKRAGIPVVVNSDAHYPELINASRDEALRMWDGI